MTAPANTVSVEKIAEMLAALKSADAWLHPTADWAHKSNGYVAAHCARGGPRPLPLYQIDAPAITAILNELVAARSQLDALTAKWIEADEDAKVQKEFLAVADARVDALTAERERGWCQPKDMKHRVWVVMYEDADRGNAVFTHEDAERQAKEHYVRSAPSWNCYLFAAQPELIGTAEGREIEDRLSGRAALAGAQQ